MKKRTRLMKKAAALTAAFTLVCAQSAPAGQVYAADPETNVRFVKEDGSEVLADENNTINVNLMDAGELKVGFETAGLRWSSTPANGVIANGDFSGTMTCSGTIDVTAQYMDTENYDDHTDHFVLNVAPSGVTELKASIDGEDVLNNGVHYCGDMSNGITKKVTLYGKIGNEWIKVPQSAFTLSDNTMNAGHIVGPYVNNVGERNSFSLDTRDPQGGAVLKAQMNEADGMYITFTVKNGEAPGLADKTELDHALEKAQAVLDDTEHVYDAALLQVLSDAVIEGKEAAEDKLAAQGTVDAAVEKIMTAVTAVETTPVLYFQTEDGTIIYPEENVFTLTSLKVGKFHVSNAEDPDWNCVELLKSINEETGKTLSEYRYWISADGSYQPKEPKIMDASVSYFVNGDQQEKKFKIDTRSTGVTKIRAFVDGVEKGPEDVVNVSGKEWTKVSVKGLLNGEWIDLPRQSFYIVPQYNTHIYEDKFCLWQSDHEFDMVVRLFDQDDITTGFKAVSGFVKLQSFDVSVPKTTWVLDRWDSMTNSFTGLRWYETGSDRGYSLEVVPANATDWDLEWKSSDESVAYFQPLHSGGIVANKAGKVHFDITSRNNPQASDQLDLEFVYKTPLKGVSYEADQELEAGGVKEVVIHTVPEDATDRRFVWTCDKEGIVNVDQQVSTDADGNTVVKYVLSADKDLTGESQVTVTGTPVDDTQGCENVVLHVNVKGAEEKGWVEDNRGWWYKDGNGGFYADELVKIDGRTYYFDPSGYMITGWLEKDGNWRYFDQTGAMVSGWINDNGNWSYADENGCMQTGWKHVDGKWYYLGDNGVMASGWKYVDGKWYYLEADGAMASGWKYVDGKWYYLEADGAMASGWKYVDEKWYYLEADGAMASGWKLLGSTWYYMEADGRTLQNEWRWIDDRCYYFQSDCSMAVNTIIDGSYVNTEGVWTA